MNVYIMHKGLYGARSSGQCARLSVEGPGVSGLAVSEPDCRSRDRGSAV